VTIVDRTLIDYGVEIFSSNHHVPPNHGSIFEAGYSKRAILIGKDVWLSANVIVLPGRTIGDGAVVESEVS